MPDPKPTCSTALNNSNDYQEFLKAAHQLDSKDGVVDGRLRFTLTDVQSRYLVIAEKHIVDASQAQTAYRDFYTNQLKPEGKNLQAALAKVTKTCLNVPGGVHNSESFLPVITAHPGDDTKKILYEKLLKIDPQNHKAKLELLKLALKADNATDIKNQAAALLSVFENLNDEQKKNSYEALLQAAEKLSAAGKNDQAQAILTKLVDLVDDKDKIPNFIAQVSAASTGDPDKKTELLDELKKGILAKDTEPKKFERLLKAAEALGSTDRDNAEIFLSAAIAHLNQSNTAQVKAFTKVLEKIFAGDDEAKAKFLAKEHQKTFLQKLEDIGLPVDSSANLRSKIFQLASILKDRPLARSQDDKKEVQKLYKFMLNEETIYGPSSDYDFYYYRALLGLVGHTKIKTNKEQIIKDLEKVESLAKSSKDPDLLARAILLIAYTEIKEGPLGLTHETIFQDIEDILNTPTTKPEQWQGYYIARILPHYWNMLTMREPTEIRSEIAQLQQFLSKMKNDQLDSRLEGFKKKALEEHFPNENLFGLARDFYGKSFFSDAEIKTFENLQDTLNRRVGQEQIAKTVRTELAVLAEKTGRALSDLKATQEVAQNQGKSLSAEIAESLFKKFFERHFKGKADDIKTLMDVLSNKAQQGEIKGVADLLSGPLAILKKNTKKFIKNDPAIEIIYKLVSEGFPKTSSYLKEPSSLILLTKDPLAFLDEVGEKLTEDLESNSGLKNIAKRTIEVFVSGDEKELESLLKKFEKDEAKVKEIVEKILELRVKRPLLVSALSAFSKLLDLNQNQLTKLIKIGKKTSREAYSLPPLIIDIGIEIYQGYAKKIFGRYERMITRQLKRLNVDTAEMNSLKTDFKDLKDNFVAFLQDPTEDTTWNGLAQSLDKLKTELKNLLPQNPVPGKPNVAQDILNLLEDMGTGFKTAKLVFTFGKGALLQFFENPKSYTNRLSFIQEFKNLKEEDLSNPLILLDTLSKVLDRILQGDLNQESTIQELGNFLHGLGILRKQNSDNLEILKTKIKTALGFETQTKFSVVLKKGRAILADLREGLEKFRGVTQMGLAFWQGFQSFRTSLAGEELTKLKEFLKSSDLTKLTEIFDLNGKLIKPQQLKIQISCLNAVLTLFNIPNIKIAKDLDELSEFKQGESIALLISERLFALMENLGIDQGADMKKARKIWNGLKSDWTWTRYKEMIGKIHTTLKAQAGTITNSTDTVLNLIRYRDGSVRPDPIQLSIAVSDLLGSMVELGGNDMKKDFRKVLIGFRAALQLYVQLESTKELAKIVEDMASDFKDFTNYLTSFNFSVGNWKELKTQLKHHKDLLLNHLEKIENVLGRIKEQIRRSDLAKFIPAFTTEIIVILENVQNISEVIRTSFEQMEKVADKLEDELIENVRGVALEFNYLKLDKRVDAGLNVTARFDVSLWRPNPYLSVDVPLRLMLDLGLFGGAEVGLAGTINPCGGVENWNCNLILNPSLYFDGETDLDGDGTRNFMGGLRPRFGISIDRSVGYGIGLLGVGAMWAPSIQFRDTEHWGDLWWRGFTGAVTFHRPFE